MTRFPTMTWSSIRPLCVLATLVVLIGPAVAHGQDVRRLYRVNGNVSDAHVEYHRIAIPKGGQVVLADLKGPGLVTRWYFTDDTQGKLDEGLVLKVIWDDTSGPSINVPLAHFFGVFHRKTIDYQSQALQINHYCYECYLPMPFSKRARFLLANDSDHDYSQSVAYGIDYEKGESFATETSRLHACWSRSNPTQKGLHTIVATEGAGHYVGNFLQVYSRYNGWWGEGDTIFHLDGKPITHTPGTEDEYGSCWEFGHKFVSPSCGYLEMENGQNRMYRWYVVNPVRFKTSLKVEIQNQRYENGQIPSRDDYISVGFWYLDGARTVSLAPYAERSAASKAGEYKGK